MTGPRGEVPPGSEGQVDYGLLGRWFNPVTQRTRRVWAFVLVLARRNSRPRPWRSHLLHFRRWAVEQITS